MRRLLPFLICALLASPAAAGEVVLRDTIGPDSSATDGKPGGVSTTFQTSGNGWNMPGMRFTNVTARPLRLLEARVAMFGRDLVTGDPVNDIPTLLTQPYQFHLWTDGIEGPGDTFENIPWGEESFGHVAIDLNFGGNDVLSVEELGVTGPPGQTSLFTTFVFSASLSEFDVVLQPGNEYVFNIVERSNGDSIVLRTLKSALVMEEDLFKEIDQALSPGYLGSQFGDQDINYAGFISAEFLDGDYNNDGVVNAADYVVWRKHEGTSGNPPYTLGDGDGDGDTDQDDYLTWHANFGATLSTLGSGNALSAVVPEPSSLLLAAIAVSAGLFHGLRKVR